MTPEEYRRTRRFRWRRFWWRSPLGRAWFRARTLWRERDRLRAWKHRHHPDTHEEYSWKEAARAVIENPPSFDALWDEEMEPRPRP